MQTAKDAGYAKPTAEKHSLRDRQPSIGTERSKESLGASRILDRQGCTGTWLYRGSAM